MEDVHIMCVFSLCDPTGVYLTVRSMLLMFFLSGLLIPRKVTGGLGTECW